MEQIKFINDYESADFYDALPRFSKNVYKYLESIGLINSVVADVGCGTGRVTADLLDSNNIVYAIDPDSNMRSICNKKCFGKKGFILVDGSDYKMNIPDKSVDYVLVSQAFHRFNIKLFREECNRVLKNKDNVIIIWYRIDYKDPIYSQMLEVLKKDFLEYKTRYDCDEYIGSKIEEENNNKGAKEFFNGNSHVEDIISTSKLSYDEFMKLGLSLSLFPISHKLNNTSIVLKDKSFNVKKYKEDLTTIFNRYSINNKIELSCRVQIHSKN